MISILSAIVVISIIVWILCFIGISIGLLYLYRTGQLQIIALTVYDCIILSVTDLIHILLIRQSTKQLQGTIIRISKNIVTTVLADEDVQLSIGYSIVVGMNLFVRQPDLDEHILLMSETIARTQPELARMSGEDFTKIVSSFFTGLFLSNNNNNNNSSSSSHLRRHGTTTTGSSTATAVPTTTTTTTSIAGTTTSIPTTTAVVTPIAPVSIPTNPTTNIGTVPTTSSSSSSKNQHDDDIGINITNFATKLLFHQQPQQPARTSSPTSHPTTPTLHSEQLLSTSISSSSSLSLTNAAEDGGELLLSSSVPTVMQHRNPKTNTTAAGTTTATATTTATSAIPCPSSLILLPTLSHSFSNPGFNNNNNIMYNRGNDYCTDTTTNTLGKDYYCRQRGYTMDGHPAISTTSTQLLPLDSNIVGTIQTQEQQEKHSEIETTTTTPTTKADTLVDSLFFGLRRRK